MGGLSLSLSLSPFLGLLKGILRVSIFTLLGAILARAKDVGKDRHRGSLFRVSSSLDNIGVVHGRGNRHGSEKLIGINVLRCFVGFELCRQVLCGRVLGVHNRPLTYWLPELSDWLVLT